MPRQVLHCAGDLRHFVDHEMQFSNSSSVPRVTACSQHSMLLANLSHSWSRFLTPRDSSCPATDHVQLLLQCCRSILEVNGLYIPVAMCVHFHILSAELFELVCQVSSLRVLPTTCVLRCSSTHALSADVTVVHVEYGCCLGFAFLISYSHPAARCSTGGFANLDSTSEVADFQPKPSRVKQQTSHSRARGCRCVQIIEFCHCVVFQDDARSHFGWRIHFHCSSAIKNLGRSWYHWFYPPLQNIHVAKVFHLPRLV